MEMAERVAKRGQLFQALAFQTALLQPEFQIHARAELREAEQANPQDANVEFIRDNVELVPIGQAEGRIAAEGALPYPPGVLCVVPGEVWGGAVQRYFLALEEGINRLPGFSPELQGVYIEKKDHGWKRIFGYMIKP